MKKFITIVIGLLMTGLAYGATAPINFVMSTPIAGYTPVSVIKIQFDMQVATAGYDSIIVVSSADSSVCVATIDTTGIVWGIGKHYTGYVTGLNPDASYKWMIRVLKGSTHTQSNADTLSTLTIPLNNERLDPNITTLDPVKIKRWDSWQAYGLDNRIFTMVGETDADSTIYYAPWKYNNVFGVASCASDSVNCTLLWYAGYYEKPGIAPKMAFVDSLNIISVGNFNTGSLGVPVDNAMYFKLRNNTGAGGVSNPQTFTLILNRNRD